MACIARCEAYDQQGGSQSSHSSACEGDPARCYRPWVRFSRGHQDHPVTRRTAGDLEHRNALHRKKNRCPENGSLTSRGRSIPPSSRWRRARSTKQGVAATLPEDWTHSGVPYSLHIIRILRESVRDSAHARAIARQVGQVCQNLCDERGVRHLHLFVAIPVELAVLIGHQLNALCPITLYEFKNYERVYTPIGMLHS